jgi:hypothetical protein
MPASPHDTRPAFARFLWRDRTQEHWAESIAIDTVVVVVNAAITIAVLYVTQKWWVPFLQSIVCK